MGAVAQEKIYRCGSEYTNMPPAASVSKCILITQGNVTVVPAVKAPPAVSQAPVSAARTSGQRSKDADARFILESELKKAQARLAELRTDYNNGEPEKQGAESRNYQKYLDRVAEMKANIQRSEADVASLMREIARLTPAR
jgi:hypothetical protein